MDTDSFIVHVKTHDIYKNFTEDVETSFATSNFELDRPLPKGKNKKVIELMKDELGGQIMKEFFRLRAKKNDEDKKAKGAKKCVIRNFLKFYSFKEYYK